MVHGEVLFPNAVTWEKGLEPDDYIAKMRRHDAESQRRESHCYPPRTVKRSNAEDVDEHAAGR